MQASKRLVGGGLLVGAWAFGCEAPELELLATPPQLPRAVGGAGGAEDQPAGLPADFRVRYLRVVVKGQIRVGTTELSVALAEITWSQPEGEYPVTKPLSDASAVTASDNASQSTELAAFDADPSTSWRTALPDELPSSITLDLGARRAAPQAVRVEIFQTGLRDPSGLEFLASADGVTWYRQLVVGGWSSWSEPGDQFSDESRTRSFELPPPDQWRES